MYEASSLLLESYGAVQLMGSSAVVEELVMKISISTLTSLNRLN